MANSTVSPYDWAFEISNPTLFAGRRDELDLIEEQISRLSKGQRIPLTAIIGERRVGKSSVLLRTAEICEKYNILAPRITLNLTTAMDPWEFWNGLFHEIMKALQSTGISLSDSEALGFKIGAETKQRIVRLQFESAYNAHCTHTGPQILASHIVRDDLKLISDALGMIGKSGLILMIDEAHRFQDIQESGTTFPIEIKNQLREALRIAENCSLIFAGEPKLSQIFNKSSEPFYGQVNTIGLQNFTSIDDIAECALLPLKDGERDLMSPMTIDYLAQLSQGKPNQIRLICDSIYNRYQKGNQGDLNITVDILDDVIEKVGTGLSFEYDLKNKVNTIRNLGSVELEALYNMNRYPNWSIEDIVDLDESFRGEMKSDEASERRRNLLKGKRQYFISIGLMADEQDRCVLAGDEFLYLYLRFWLQIRKYGRLARKLVLGKGPQTPFGEKTEKLVNALAWELRRGAGIRRFVFHPNERERGEVIIEKIKERCNTLNNLVSGKLVLDRKSLSDIADCFQVCELVNKPGKYYLLCLNVRNRDNPRELMQIELYFDYSELHYIDVISLTKLLNQQIQNARILLEGCDSITVELLNLPKLLEALKGPTMQEFLSKLDVVGQWRISSVQRILSDELKEKKEQEKEGKEDEEEESPDISEECIKRYAGGNLKEAEECFSAKLKLGCRRDKQSKLYNDRGYVRHSLKQLDLARKDLETALDLHYPHLPLALLNIGMLDIDEKDYDRAIKNIENAIFLILSSEEIKASYLRTILPECHLNYRVRWEQRPANLLEVAYINYAYIILQINGLEDALKVLDEGLSIVPSSVYLKHAKARYFLYDKKAKLADPLYRELLEAPIRDQALLQELKLYSKYLPRKKPKI